MAKKGSKVKSDKNVEKTVKELEKPKTLKQDTISFDYIKSNQFRVIRADGVHGGITPKGGVIQMALFSERAPIPKKETFQLQQGKLGKQIDREERDAVIREVEVEVLIDLETAKAINKWLETKIKSATELEKEVK